MPSLSRSLLLFLNPNIEFLNPEQIQNLKFKSPKRNKTRFMLVFKDPALERLILSLNTKGFYHAEARASARVFNVEIFPLQLLSSS
jgi:hypothetical protein